MGKEVTAFWRKIKTRFSAARPHNTKQQTNFRYTWPIWSTWQPMKIPTPARPVSHIALATHSPFHSLFPQSRLPHLVIPSSLLCGSSGEISISLNVENLRAFWLHVLMSFLSEMLYESLQSFGF